MSTKQHYILRLIAFTILVVLALWPRRCERGKTEQPESPRRYVVNQQW